MKEVELELSHQKSSNLENQDYDGYAGAMRSNLIWDSLSLVNIRVSRGKGSKHMQISTEVEYPGIDEIKSFKALGVGKEYAWNKALIQRLLEFEFCPPQTSGNIHI